MIGKSGKNIPEEDALKYVAGHIAGDDVSPWKWQRDPAYAGVVPQWCFSKRFDRYAPLGPCIVSQKSLMMQGVAMGINPPKCLKDGDVVEVYIEKIDTLNIQFTLNRYSPGGIYCFIMAVRN